ncbi:MAG: methyltransferase [Chitinivibrionales bacterium]|nr:methyltransferase [Chitinivibrionales bacterium]MBD3356090.1 methyltransferase [Chitinivibrionales bacterium]
MKLRIVGGSLKRRVMEVKGGLDDFRPTLERTREALAESLKTRIFGASVVDLCAGSGIFGFEMLSRGAAYVHFVEDHRGRAAAIKSISRRFGVEQQCRVIVSDVDKFLQRTQDLYDIIYFDPPYDVEGLAALLPEVVTHLSDGGICLYEHRKGDGHECLIDRQEGVESRHRNYGRTRVDFITRVAPLNRNTVSDVRSKDDD